MKMNKFIPIHNTPAEAMAEMADVCSGQMAEIEHNNRNNRMKNILK